MPFPPQQRAPVGAHIIGDPITAWIRAKVSEPKGRVGGKTLFQIAVPFDLYREVMMGLHDEKTDYLDTQMVFQRAGFPTFHGILVSSPEAFGWTRPPAPEPVLMPAEPTSDEAPLPADPEEA